MQRLKFIWFVLICAAVSGCGVETASEAQTAAAAAPESRAAPDGAAAPAAAPEAAETVPPMGQIDDSAVELLKAMTDTVVGLSAFTFTLESGFDVMQVSGQKLEFGARRSAVIRRPDHARFTYEDRTGMTGELVFDGTSITAYEGEQNVYASIGQPGDIDASVELVAMELGIPIPASDFFAADPAAALAEGVLEARDLGASTINRQSGHHIALRKPNVDYQIWISEETKLPMRVVITYREEPGQPQFWAQFLEWNTAPTLADDVFEFTPPESAERIRFGVFDDSEEIGDET